MVYADLGAIDWLRPREEFHEYLRALVRAGFGKRSIFGSDQMVWPEGIGMAIEGIESASFLTEERFLSRSTKCAAIAYTMKGISAFVERA